METTVYVHQIEVNKQELFTFVKFFSLRLRCIWKELVLLGFCLGNSC